MTVFDATYSAFYLPISVGWHEWLTWFIWFNVLDFIGGEHCLCLSLCLRLRLRLRLRRSAMCDVRVRVRMPACLLACMRLYACLQICTIQKLTD